MIDVSQEILIEGMMLAMERRSLIADLRTAQEQLVRERQTHTEERQKMDDDLTLLRDQVQHLTSKLEKYEGPESPSGGAPTKPKRPTPRPSRPNMRPRKAAAKSG